MKVNLDDAAHTGLLPEGEYVARIADAKDETSKAGNEMLVIDLIVHAGEFKGAEVRDWIVPFNRLGAGKLKALLEATQLSVPSGDFELKVSDLIGKRAEIVVRHDLYNGEQQPRIKGYQPPVGSDVPVEADPIAVGGSNGVVDDEDIPF